MDITKITSQGVQGTSPKKTKATTGQKFSIDETDTTKQTTGTPGIVLNPVDALFLNLDQQGKNRRQAVQRSTEILNQLDELRFGIISGQIPKNILERIASLLQAHSLTITEEPLRTLLLEVETRAKVELAKLEK